MKDLRNWRRFSYAAVAAFTLVHSVLSVVQGFCPKFAPGPLSYICATLLIACGAYVINGIWIEGFLIGEAIIKISSIGTEIHVKRGDIFDCDGVAVVAVNDFFDTRVDDRHINADSIHGQLIVRFWPGCVPELDSQIEESLADCPATTVRRDGEANERRYKVGTSAFVKTSKGRRFILTALTETDPKTHKTQSNIEMLGKTVRGALRVARERANGDPIAFYVMGGGNARINASEMMLFTTLLTSIMSECLENGKVSSRINIFLHKASSIVKINLYDLGKVWSV